MTPAPSGHEIGEPEKPGPMPVASIAGPDARNRMNGARAALSPATTSRISMSKLTMSTPLTTDLATHRMPFFT